MSTLRDITAADIDVLYQWRNDPENRPMFRDDRPLDFAAHQRFVRRYLEDRGGNYWWIVEAAQQPVGTISLYHFSADRCECEFGRFVIGQEHRGQGYGRQALSAAMDSARSLGVERMTCEVLSTNEPALRLYSSLGFRYQRTDDAGPRSFVWMEANLSRR